ERGARPAHLRLQRRRHQAAHGPLRPERPDLPNAALLPGADPLRPLRGRLESRLRPNGSDQIVSNILASIILALPAVALTIAGIELDGWHAGLMAFGAAAYLVLLVLLGVTFRSQTLRCYPELTRFGPYEGVSNQGYDPMGVIK